MSTGALICAPTLRGSASAVAPGTARNLCGVRPCARARPATPSARRPVLGLMEDGDDWTSSSIREAVINQFQLTPEDIEERLPSGRDTALRNRVGWALTYL
jgi:Mrr N-terminal domain